MNLHELKLESQTYKLFIKPQKKTIINYDKEDPLIFGDICPWKSYQFPLYINEQIYYAS
jgi:hypothetical protein